MSSYKVGLQDLKFLVNSFEAYGYTRKGAVEWLRENKKDLTPEFMRDVYNGPDSFFYYETHFKQKIENFNLIGALLEEKFPELVF